MEAFIPQMQQLMLDLVGNMTAGPKAPRKLVGEDDCKQPDDCPGSLIRELRIFAEARDFAVEVIKKFMESKVSELASRHNRTVAISSLPNEVLSIIFEYAHAAAVADADPEEVEGEVTKDAKGKHKAPVRFALCASHVSKSWRDIAINTPWLWTRIDAPVLRFVDTCLSRSKGLPLNIMFQKPSAATLADRVQYEESVERCIPSLLTHVERWQSLALSDVRPIYYLSIFPFSPATLEKLDLTGIVNDDQTDQIPFRSQMLTKKLPRLRELTLCDIKIPISSPIYRNLISLTLERISFDDPIEDFIRTLGSCPLIETLTLVDIFFLDDEDPLPSNPPIALLHLKEMQFHALYTYALGDILSSIRTPPTVQIYGHCLLDVDDNLDLIFPRSGIVFNTTPSLSEITSLTFNFMVNETTFSLTCASGTFDADTSDFILKIEFEPAGDWVSVDALSRRIFLNLGRVFPLPNLVSLTLVGAAPNVLRPPDFVKVLRRLSHITHLKFDYCSATLMNTVGSGRLSLPNLTSLSFSDLMELKMRPAKQYIMQMISPVDFCAMLARLPTLETIQFTNCSVGLIQTLESTRAKRLCPRLEDLILEKCDISGADLIALAESRTKWRGEEVLDTIWVVDCAGVDEQTIARLEDIVSQVQVLRR
ncbi:hypothetical protein BOTBODRAFT_35880 [Botryobasidium botryosum FD-172 SS1]|uniref:F-box domain-containing protein n=1 Tax=Botryobasidium botryosum (strain FD-172 SS1) TaxID=930990 RepID=A0A067M5B9_BOTB1|nr:hypothetical protein BOTBODRAFT_35880 [Botryobasidium botryosum FD-172 SS1]